MLKIKGKGIPSKEHCHEKTQNWRSSLGAWSLNHVYTGEEQDEAGKEGRDKTTEGLQGMVMLGWLEFIQQCVVDGRWEWSGHIYPLERVFCAHRMKNGLEAEGHTGDKDQEEGYIFTSIFLGIAVVAMKSTKLSLSPPLGPNVFWPIHICMKHKYSSFLCNH
jgi:hypothetical protein